MKLSGLEGYRYRDLALIVLMVLGFSTVFVACHPDMVSDVGELDAVLTQRDPGTDFGSFRRWAMPDTVVDLSEYVEGDTNEWSNTSNDLILTDIARNMQQYGYTRVEPDDTQDPITWPDGEPDVIILVGGLSSNGYIVSSWYPWYPGWGWYPGGGWYYPWYPTTTVQEFKTGTIAINMIDFHEYDPEQELYKGAWQGILNGVGEGSSSSIESRITRGIDQAFTQSSYLRTTAK